MVYERNGWRRSWPKFSSLAINFYYIFLEEIKMKVYKDNFITDHLFNILLAVNPTVAIQLIRTKLVASSENDTDGNEISEWVRENCDGLIYFVDDSTAYYREHYICYFEKEEDAVAFKLRWG